MGVEVEERGVGRDVSVVIYILCSGSIEEVRIKRKRKKETEEGDVLLQKSKRK